MSRARSRDADGLHRDGGRLPSAPLTLLEREAALASIAAAVAGARAGLGQVIVIVAAAGIGKTRLIDQATHVARGSGLRKLGARGAEFERGFPWGVVRQLFEPALFVASPARRGAWFAGAAELAGPLLDEQHKPYSAASDDELSFARLHGLYWLCANAALDAPLLIAVDDVQWADELSLQFLNFLVPRVRELPVAVILASRPAEHASPAALRGLLADPAAEVLRPGPLSAAGVRNLIRALLGRPGDEAFTAACREATRGNPFLLTELLHELRAAGVAPVASEARRARALGSRGVASAVLGRLARLSPEALRLASALAVLAEPAALADAAELAEVQRREAAAAALALQEADILERRGGLRFAHPIVRSSLEADLVEVERGRLHARAARIRARRGGPVEEVAAHVLQSEPAGDPWAVERLRRGAREALRLGDSAAAVDLLRRALREPPTPGAREELLAELGSAEARTGAPEAADHLAQAIGATTDKRRRALISLELATLLTFSFDVVRAVDVLRNAAADLGEADADLAARLNGAARFTRYLDPSALAAAHARLPAPSEPAGDPAGVVDALTLAGMAFDAAAELQPAPRVAELARRALRGDFLLQDTGQPLVVATLALICAEELEPALAVLGDAVGEARRRGSPVALARLWTMRAMAGYRRGLLLQAEQDATAAFELSGEIPAARALSSVALAYVVLTGLDRGRDPEELRRLLDDPRVEHDRAAPPATQLLLARGAVHAAAGELDRALEDLHACDLPDPLFGGGNPSLVPWRSAAAVVHERRGDGRAAQRLAAEEVRLARRFGAPRALGAAMRVAALVGARDERRARLREAAHVLEQSQGMLELARAWVDLGALARVLRDRDEARVLLTKGHDLARGCGAAALAARAGDELACLGVRVRRARPDDRERLTPAERRIADLVADGCTNREVAQALFVTEKTVETHLSHVYDKLGVRSRHKLPRALRVSATPDGAGSA